MFVDGKIICDVSMDTIDKDLNIDSASVLNKLKELGVISWTVRQVYGKQRRYYTFPTKSNNYKIKQIDQLNTDCSVTVKRKLNITEKELKELGYVVDSKTHKFKKEK